MPVTDGLAEAGLCGRTTGRNCPGRDRTAHSGFSYRVETRRRAHLHYAEDEIASFCSIGRNNAILSLEASKNRDAARVADTAMRCRLSALPRTRNRGRRYR